MSFFSAAVELGTSDTDVFEMGAGLNGAGVLMLSNRNGSSRTVSIKFYKQSIATTITLQSAFPIAANTMTKIAVPLSLEPGDKIIMSCSNASSVSVQATITASTAQPIAQGFTPRGEYDSGTTYAKNDLVRVDADKTTYLSMQNANEGNTPSSSPTYWMAFQRDRGIPAPVTLSDVSTPALDAEDGDVFTLTATQNPTIGVPSNPSAGQKIIIAFTASGANRTLALNAGTGGFRFGTDVTALSQTTQDKTDYVGCVYNATANKWDVIAYTKGL